MGIEELLSLRRKTPRCDQVISIISPPKHRCLVGAAEARHRLYQRVEHCLEFDGGAADSLEHVCGGGLLQQRLREIMRLGLHLAEQADVADRDHGLIGEGLQQFNLFLAEWTYLQTAKRNYSDALAFAQQRYGQHGASTVPACEFAAVGKLVAFRREEVMHMNSSAVDCRTPRDPQAVDWSPFPDDWDRPVLHLEYKLIAIPQDDVGLFPLANYAGALYDRRQNRSDIGRRRGDHLEDIGAAGLVGEGLSQIARPRLHLLEQPGVLDRDHCLVGKALEQVDLLGGERPHFGTIDKDSTNQCVILDHRDANGRSRAPVPCGSADHRLSSIIRGVAHLLCSRSHDTIKVAARRRPEP